MEPARPRRPLPWSLFGAIAFSLPTAVLTASCLPAAAALAAAGWLLACHTRHPLRHVGLAALPALLAALGTRPLQATEVPLGPTRVTGTVAEVLRSPTIGSCALRLRGAHTEVWVTVVGDVEALPGDRVAALARGAQAPCPDRSRRLHAQADNVVVTAAPPSLRRAIVSLRRHCERTLLTFVPGDAGAVLATLVLGRDTRPTVDVADAHRGTGLSHLLAVSGAHAAMLAQLLGLSTLRRGQRLRRSRTYTLLVLAVLITYAAIAGGEPPVVRAVLGYMLASLAVPLGRPMGLAVGLGAPALLTCFVAPTALLGASFLLSYAAVLGLALAPQPVAGGGVRAWLTTALLASFWAAAATAPLTLFWFGQLAPWTVLLTPLLAPLVALLLFGGLSLCVVGAVAPLLATPLGVVLGAVTDLYTNAVTVADTLPGTPIAANFVPAAWWLTVAAMAAVLPLYLLRQQPRRSVLAALVVLCAPFFVPLGKNAAATLRLFAVGHGQSALFDNGHGARVAIDCGSMQQPQLAARRLLDALPHRHLDLLIITHGDADHHNGVNALLGPLHISSAILPEGLRDSTVAQTLRAAGVAVTFLAAGATSEPLPGVQISAPALPAGASDNDQSLWCRLRLGTATALLTGDAQALGVAAALASGIAAAADVLVLPHHGRANPLAPVLLRRVEPRVCFASATGADGDTPLGELVRRSGAELFVTGQVGTIELSLSGDGAPQVRTSEAWRPLPTRRGGEVESQR